jgi:hypothetical protein
VVLALAVMVASAVVSPGVAPASVRGGASVRAARSSRLTLSQAPAGLRAAVRSTLGAQAVRAGSAFDKAKLTASDGASGDAFGNSVALYRSTAVVGAPNENSNTGAAYVFVHTSAGWSQQAKLTASDGAGNDLFGFSVAVDGSTAVVGAVGKSTFTGAVYVFVRSGTSWSQQAELTPSDAAFGENFGGAVATSGSTVVIGAPRQNLDTGAAYVFARSGSSWSQRAKLTASDAARGDFFGASVAVSGSTALIGAPGKNSATGAAYVFVPSGTSWSQQAKLTASNGASGDNFGFSVAVSGSTAVLGAVGDNSGRGAAYVFARSGTTWSQQAELTASDGASGDVFGVSVAIRGSTVVVGAPQKNSFVGAAYVFLLPSQGAELTASDAAAGDEFGFSVAISGATAVIGAPDKNSHTGAAYVFVHTNSRWSQQATLTASDAAKGDFFGASVAVSGPTVVVGADGKNSGTGAAYVFARSGTSWSQQAKLTASDAASGDDFGTSVAISGSTAVVGADHKNSGTGAAYVFTRSGTGWSQQVKLTATDAASGDGFGFAVAVSGRTAVVGALGKNSDAGAAYVFVHSGMAWSQQAELTASDGASGDFFGVSVWTLRLDRGGRCVRQELEQGGGVRVRALGQLVAPAGQADRLRRHLGR